MKKLLTLLVVLCSATFFAQTSGITYQAVILNPEGQHIPGHNNERSPIVNKIVCMRFTIYAGTTAEYQETQQTTTDEFGMVNLVIGTGSPTGGTAATFADIIWDGNPKNLQAEVSLTGICLNFTEISNQPLTAVPYALYAANSGTAGPQGEDGNLTLVNTTTEAAGTNCATGGVKLEFGVDLNRNGTLETEEIATGLTKYVCNGAAGPQGTAGTAGPAGPAGPQGVAGVAGAQGAQGIQGVPGPTGAAGPQGTAGNNGLSAYQVAVANGYVGTEQQWLTSIQGAAGTNGQSAYQIAVANGFTGTQTEWLASLVGENGNNGKNTLIITSNETAGINCINGGTKIEIGLDENSNGILDPLEINTNLTRYVCNGSNNQSGSSSSSGYFLSVTDLPVPEVRGSCATNGGPLENKIASAGSWWTLPSAVGWYSCYQSPNTLWQNGCGSSGQIGSVTLPTVCQLQISSPVPSQIIHTYTNLNSNKIQYNINKIGQCFDTRVSFKFYDINNNLIPSFAEYKRGVTNQLMVTSYLSSNITQIYNVSRNDFSISFYENSLTLFLPEKAVKMEIIFDGLPATNFSQSCLQSLYTTRTPAYYSGGIGGNNGQYYLGDITYSLLKWE
ncbi:MAG: hypothetical protein RIT03_1121 [Bacteroidota bacterium]|jgi:hypothetical protein